MNSTMNRHKIKRWAGRHTNHQVTALEPPPPPPPPNETSKSHTSPSKRVQGVDREAAHLLCSCLNVRGQLWVLSTLRRLRDTRQHNGQRGGSVVRQSHSRQSTGFRRQERLPCIFGNSSSSQATVYRSACRSKIGWRTEWSCASRGWRLTTAHFQT